MVDYVNNIHYILTKGDIMAVSQQTQIRINPEIKKEASPNYNKETIDAMLEAKKISKDSNIPSYSSIEELKNALED